MTAIDRSTLIDQLKWRYATKVFDPTKKISTENWKALEQSLVLTPSSFGMQPWKFFIVTDASVKSQLLTVSWNQKQVVDCSHHVVFAIQTNVGGAEVEKYLKRMSDVQGTSLDALAGFKKMLLGFLSQPQDKFNVDEWATRQVYIALGNFMTSAAMLGIDACPMEGINPAKYDEILGLTAKGYKTVVACSTGYRSAEDKYAAMPKVRYETGDVIENI